VSSETTVHAAVFGRRPFLLHVYLAVLSSLIANFEPTVNAAVFGHRPYPGSTPCPSLYPFLLGPLARLSRPLLPQD